MGIKFNPLLLNGFDFTGTGGGSSGVSSVNGITGAVVLAAGTGITLVPSGNTITINSSGGGSSPSIGGTVTGGSAGSVLFINPASTLAQDNINFNYNATTHALTITGALSASNLSGSNTGDITLGTPNGLSLSSQVLSLGLASTSTSGALSSTDWNIFNNKIPLGQGYNVQLFTLNSTQITNKAVSLSKSPTTDSLTRLTVVGGPEQSFGADFTESAGTISWSGLFLDGVLAVGDQLIIAYN